MCVWGRMVGSAGSQLSVWFNSVCKSRASLRSTSQPHFNLSTNHTTQAVRRGRAIKEPQNNHLSATLFLMLSFIKKMSWNRPFIIRDTENMVWSFQITLEFVLVSHLWLCVCTVSHSVLQILCRNVRAISEEDVWKIAETISQNACKVSTTPGLEETFIYDVKKRYWTAYLLPSGNLCWTRY